MVKNTQTVFSIERMQPDWLPTPLQRWFYIIGVMLLTGFPIGLLVGWGSGFPIGITDLPAGRVFGIGIGLATGLAVCLAVRRAFGLIGTLIVGSVFGLAFGITFEKYYGISVACYVGLAVGLAAGGAFGLVGRRLIDKAVTSWDHVDIIEMLSWSWSKAMLGLAVGLIAGSVFGFTVGLAIWKPIASSFGVAFGIAAGLVAALLSGLTGGEAEIRTSPNQGIWRSVRNAISIGMAGMLAVGLPIGVATGLAWREFWVATSLTVGVTIGLTIGLAFGITLSLFFGGLAAVKHFTLRFILYCNRSIPWNLVRFLDYSAERIFLRKVGGGYIFVHRTLMEYFASLNQSQVKP